MDVDLKLASRVSGIDVILGGHTHDAVPDPVPVKNRAGVTLVTNAGCNGKFLAVLDLEVKNKQITGYQYRLMPVFANLLEPDPEMAELIRQVRAPYEVQLAEKLALSEGLLYRRGNFNGTFDQVILDALMEVKSAEIAFSPGFRWGTTLLPNQDITLEDLMDQTAITYPAVTLTEMTGETIKSVLEDVCDNLFNPDPYRQQGGDMVRVGGMQYRCDPTQTIGSRISNMTSRGKPIEAGKKYKVAGWASVAEGVSGQPIWEVVAAYLRSKKVIASPHLNLPQLSGVSGNPGVAFDRDF
jgi:sulfur-oxidizing protein SoxB